jgi:DNA-binding transcriptional ArsR family regulator
MYNHMVVDTKGSHRADRVFHALADATRRDILLRVMKGENSVSTLASYYPMSFAAVQKHVAVLERAHLVTKQRRGREQLVRGENAEVAYAMQQLEKFETEWRDRLDRFEAVLQDHLKKGTDS